MLIGLRMLWIARVIRVFVPFRGFVHILVCDEAKVYCAGHQPRLNTMLRFTHLKRPFGFVFSFVKMSFQTHIFMIIARGADIGWKIDDSSTDGGVAFKFADYSAWAWGWPTNAWKSIICSSSTIIPQSPIASVKSSPAPDGNLKLLTSCASRLGLSFFSGFVMLFSYPLLLQDQRMS